MRVLVAGGAGFIGSNLSKALIDRGAIVDCIDDLSTGDAEKIGRLRQSANFSFVRGDVTDPAVVASVAGRKYSEIYHMACPTGVPNIATLGEEMMLASSVGTRNLLKLAESSGARFLFASTAEAYGDPEVFPQSETYFGNVDPVGPRSAYEEGKRFGEAMTVHYARRRGVHTRVVRIFNCYGPAMSSADTRVIPQMLSRMIAGKPVVIYGDGSQTRTFLHVDDLLAGFRLVMNDGGNGEVYNIGGASEITVLELFKVAAAITGSRIAPRFEGHFISDHRRRCPDTSKVGQLGWKQRISLEQGLMSCYRELLAARAPRSSVRESRDVGRGFAQATRA